MKGSRQLRILYIQEHRDEETALQYGPLASGEWLEERNAPPLDQMPEISGKSSDLVRELVASVPSAPTTFCESEWGRIAQMGDDAITSVGCLEEAAHCYIAEWHKSRKPTTMTAEGIRISENYANKDLY